jgi:cytochrome c biogenesis protein CcmG/thiol:disulfide interchange protein DsbE
MSIIFRSLIILLPLIIFITYGKILITDRDGDFTSFEPKAFPEFNLQDLRDGEIDLKEFNGISLLNVWASWCITCLVEHPFLTQLSNNDIKLIGLNYKDSQIKAKQWLRKRGDPYLFSIYDPRGDLAFDLGVTGAPETFLIFNQKIIGHIQGELNQEKWQSIFVPLINTATKGN